MKNKYSLGLRYWVLVVMAATVLESPCELLAADGPPVLAINVEAEKKDLFAAFARNNKSEKKEIYEKLTGEQQKKVLTYFQVGKQEQPNEKELLKGVYSLLRFYENVNITLQAVVEIQSDKYPSRDPLALAPIVEGIGKAFPSAKHFVDQKTALELDEMQVAMYKKVTEKARQEKDQARQRGKELDESIKKLDALIKAL